MMIDLAQIATILRTTPETLRQVVGGLDTPVLHFHPAPNEWCINEVIGHLIEMDKLAFADRVEMILGEERPSFQGFDVNAIAAARGDCEGDTADLLNQLADQRQYYADWVAQLPAAQLNRALVHPRLGDLTAWDFVCEWPYHDFDHLKQIANNVKAYVWPNMTDEMRRALSE